MRVKALMKIRWGKKGAEMSAQLLALDLHIRENTE